jgi:hypothetical protein
MSEDEQTTDDAAEAVEDPILTHVEAVAAAVDAAHKAGSRYLATRALVLLKALYGFNDDLVHDAMKTFFEVALGERSQPRLPRVAQEALNQFDAEERDAASALVRKLQQSQGIEAQSGDDGGSAAAVEGADAT